VVAHATSEGELGNSGAPSLRSRIVGTGLGAPSKILSNEDLAQLVDTSDEWIRTRTGIRERRVLDRERGETLSSISTEACRQALSRAGRTIHDIDLVICCTATPDTWMPISAARVLGLLGGAGDRTACFDLNAACSGYVTGLHTADAYIRSGLAKTVLLIGADIFSSILDWKDRATCVLFGDGAGAAVVEAVQADPRKDSCLIASKISTLPDMNEYLAVKGGGSRTPPGSPRYLTDERPYVTMNGREIFKSASRSMVQVARDVLAMAGVQASELRWLVPHQANQRIIENVAQMSDFPMERVYINLDRWGNTSAATVGICLAEMEERKLLQKGDLVLLDVFGGGYTYGATLLRW